MSDSCRTAVEDLIEPGKEGDGGDGGGQNVADRLGQKHGENLVAEEAGQEQDQGNQQDHLTQQGQKEGDAGLAQRHEGLLAGELHPQHEHTGGIDVQRPDGNLHQLRLVVKQRDKQARKELQRRAGGAAKAQGGEKEQAKGPLDPVQLPGAVIIAHNGLGPLGQALEQKGKDLHDTGADGHGTHRRVASVGLEGGIEGDVDQTLGGLHNEG